MDVGAGEGICHINVLFFKGGERWKEGIEMMWMKLIKESYCDR